MAFHVARFAQGEGAEVLLTSFGRVRRMTERAAGRLETPVDVLELDVNKPEDIAALVTEVESRWGRVDGILHAIAFAPEDALGGRFLTTPAESAIAAFQTSAFSLKAVAAAFAPLMPSGSSVVGLDFDASVAWPIYDWMGVAKAALESVSRYLARDLGRAGDPCQPDQRRTTRHGRRPRHPRLRAARDAMAAAVAARLGHRGPGHHRRPCLLPAVGSRPRHLR